MKKVFITEANKGIGFVTAKQLLQKGFYVYLGCRIEHRGLRGARAIKIRRLLMLFFFVKIFHHRGCGKTVNEY